MAQAMKIAVLPGDGVGTEVTAQAVKVLEAVIGNSVPLELTHAPVGGAGVAAAGDPLPAATLAIARKADAILFGAAGMPGDEAIPYAMRPGASLLRLRKELGLFANFRPAFLFPELIGASTLKPEVVQGLDLIILRELTGDVYFGEPRGIRINAKGEGMSFYNVGEVSRAYETRQVELHSKAWVRIKEVEIGADGSAEQSIINSGGGAAARSSGVLALKNGSTVFPPMLPIGKETAIAP